MYIYVCVCVCVCVSKDSEIRKEMIVCMLFVTERLLVKHLMKRD